MYHPSSPWRFSTKWQHPQNSSSQLSTVWSHMFIVLSEQMNQLFDKCRKITEYLAGFFAINHRNIMRQQRRKTLLLLMINHLFERWIFYRKLAIGTMTLFCNICFETAVNMWSIFDRFCGCQLNIKKLYNSCKCRRLCELWYEWWIVHQGLICALLYL